MRVVVAPSAGDAARQAAKFIAGQLRGAISERGRASIALSGGASPVPLFAALAGQPVDWSNVDVLQVDERVAPAGDGARNLGSIEQAFVHRGRLATGNLRRMPVETADLDAAAATYAQIISAAAGRPPVIDVVHLGLGVDGHTASLFPGDPVLDAVDRAVAVVGPHTGWRRMTLTLPVINAARSIVWFVTGAGKAGALSALIAGAGTAPSGRVDDRRAVVFADEAAAGGPAR